MPLTDIQPARDQDGVVDEPPRNTSKAKLPPSCVLKRSEFNRTKLFVADAQNYDERRSSTSITQYVDRDSRFHSLAPLNNRTAPDYAATTLHCWHDSLPFDGPVVPVPKAYDASQQCFVVFGCFCSLSCAKAFLSERSTYETGMQLVLLERMATEVYGVREVVAAPPRLSLDIYGGPYSIERFRGQRREVTLKAPPFVASYMVCEEREVARVSALGVGGISSVRGLRRPARPVDMGGQTVPDHSPYLEFLEGKGALVEAPVANSGTSRADEPTKTTGSGRAGVADGPPAVPANKRITRQSGGTLAKFME